MAALEAGGSKFESCRPDQLEIGMTSRNEKRDENFFKVAKVISEMSTCLRAKHGAVIVNPDHRIVCTGYNGSLPGEPHCDDVGCDIVYESGDIYPGDELNGPVWTKHCRRTVHAERNALMQAAKYGVAVNGCRVYITGEPCRECQKHLKAAGVTIVWPKEGKWIE